MEGGRRGGECGVDNEGEGGVRREQEGRGRGREARRARRGRERERENAPKLVPDVLALWHQARLVLAGARVHLQQVVDALAQVAPPGHLNRTAGLVPQKVLFWVFMGRKRKERGVGGEERGELSGGKVRQRTTEKRGEGWRQ